MEKILKKGMVLEVNRDNYFVESEGNFYNCSLKLKKNKKSKRKYVNPVAICDYIEFEERANNYEIKKVLPRNSTISRKGVGKNKQHLKQVLAANIDYLIIVAPIKNPEYKTGLIERFITAAKNGNVEPIVCFNKIDLLEDEKKLKEDEVYFENNSIKTFRISNLENSGINDLKDYVKGKKIAFMGKSGAGKSTLINSITNSVQAKTGEVSEKLHKGKHTTTNSRVYKIDENTYLVDTPGIREFGMTDDAELNNVFKDIEEFSNNCKFRDCSHTHEPDCAVKEAVEKNLIDKKVYKNYLRLQKGRS
ncbi:MAG: ribosome small subunit-dependent GTPase A [Thermotogota bacterium]